MKNRDIIIAIVNFIKSTKKHTLLRQKLRLKDPNKKGHRELKWTCVTSQEIEWALYMAVS